MALAMAGPAVARAKFVPYEGNASVERGEGGTRVQKNGIDYWTTGAPPRSYEIVGVITDTRDTDMWKTDAIGSKKVAKLVRQAGGDAVIMVSQNHRQRGSTVMATPMQTWRNGRLVPSRRGGYYGTSRVHEDTITEFTVVRYLRD